MLEDADARDACAVEWLPLTVRPDVRQHEPTGLTLVLAICRCWRAAAVTYGGGFLFAWSHENPPREVLYANVLLWLLPTVSGLAEVVRSACSDPSPG